MKVERYRPSPLNAFLDRVLPLPEGDWDADWRVRLPASLVLGAARAALRLPGPARPAGDGDAVVSLLHLGDQFRMLNVLSRYRHDTLTIHTNAEAVPALALYPNVVLGRTLPYHGLIAGFAPTSRGIPARVRRALVPHPTMTMPSALLFARRIAATTVAASTGEYALPRGDGIRFVEGERSSWRAFYESFFTDAFGRPPDFTRPQPHPEFRFVGRASRRIAMHLSAALAARSVPVDVAARIVEMTAAAGYVPVLLGTPAERERLVTIAGETPVEYVIGRSIGDVARVMAASRALIASDSSMMNLADAVGLPSIVMYSATLPGVHGPYYTDSRAVAASEPTIRSVAVLTGRLPMPRAAWGDVPDRIRSLLPDLIGPE